MVQPLVSQPLRIMSYDAVTSFLADQSDVIWCSHLFLGCSEGCHMVKFYFYGCSELCRMVHLLVSWLLRVMSYGAVSRFLADQRDVI